MKIGYSYWGICADFDTQASIHIDTADGSRFHRHVLVDALISRGHEVIALQEKQEPRYPHLNYNIALPEIDLLLLEWRWPTYKNSGDAKKDPDLDRQNLLLEAYHGVIPIVAMDQDFRLTAKDEQLWSKMIITEPAMNPRKLTRKRERLLPWTDWKELLPCRQPLSIYGYVGNNYERPLEFNKYYFDVAAQLRSDGIQTSMLGNWLQRSPERGAPEWMIAHTPIAFMPRCNFNSAMRVLNTFICTTHVAKLEYYANQLIPPRYFEALSVNCPALTPTNGLSLGLQTVVTSQEDVKRAIIWIKSLSFEARKELCASQRSMLKDTKLFDVSNVTSFLESL